MTLSSPRGKQVLEDCGCAVQQAVNGEEAVEAVRKHQFDAILMDCQMPVMDGYQATTAISSMMQNGEISTTPIIHPVGAQITHPRLTMFQQLAEAVAVHTRSNRVTSVPLPEMAANVRDL